MGCGVLCTIRVKKNHEETDETGQFWRVTVVENETRLRAARAIEKTEAQASVEVIKTLAARGHPQTPPPLCSEGGSGVAEALIEVYGQVPVYRGQGRPPTKKQAVEGWQYLRAVKQCDAKGHFIGTDYRVIFGEVDEVMAQLDVATVYVERTHLTMCQFSGRIVRKGLGFSKDLGMHRFAAAWDDLLYNLVRPVKRLRQRPKGQGPRQWKPRTPAMAAPPKVNPAAARKLRRVRPRSSGPGIS